MALPSVFKPAAQNSANPGTLAASNLAGTNTGDGDFLSPLTGVEISITGATTATLGRMHVCSGTTSDYTVTLPAAAGNTGKFVGVRMSSALTKLVTLDGNSTETIDGALTRIMWAGESAILMSDGTQWVKVAGKTIPMICSIRLSNPANPTAAQTITSSVVTKILLNQTDFDNTARMADLSNNQISVIRESTYSISGLVFLYLTLPCPAVFIEVSKNGVQQFSGADSCYTSNVYSSPVVDSIMDLSVGDIISMNCFQQSGADQQAIGRALGASNILTLKEIPQW